MTGVQENNRCYFCGGKLESKTTMLPFIIGDTIVVIKQVPAEVCTQCGEAVVNNEVAKRIDKVLKQAQRSGFEVSIVAYQTPELAAI